MPQTYFSKILLSGNDTLHDHVVEVEDGVVINITPAPQQGIETDYTGHYLVPSFIDLQVYGAQGKLFSVYPTVNTLQTMYAHGVETGTSSFMITVATNTTEVMYRAIDAVRQYWEMGGKGLLGLHLEGPWINPIRRGAHIASLITRPEIDDVERLLSYGRGIIKMITLAPELCSDEVLQLIKSHDVIMSAGHSNATYSEASSCFTKGISTVTHLYNAMSGFHHRDIGLPGAAFDDPKVTASIIADGFHVDFAALRIAKRLMGSRLFLITDAVTETTEGPYQHNFFDGRYMADGTLSGSSLSMLDAVSNCVKHCNISPDEAFRMASLYPAAVIGVDNGHIEAKKSASFILLDENLSVVQVCI